MKNNSLFLFLFLIVFANGIVFSSTRPTGLTAVVSGATNILNWTQVGSDGTYKLFTSSTGPISNNNKAVATVLGSYIPIGITSFKHVI